ncbi:MAE_28990/MAE_18760 family HEPN-like nuclease [Granulicella arctica]|uniref:MAE_28990/MAE_18760 family HEPN-like nuclease n=1 Tax=Granulicella arctica TaxID=940613 RepID=UPI0021DF9024|nr:MAE_28990/MAE_18760 family HEPN-like nuclease [Granulicella arctica]
MNIPELRAELESDRAWREDEIRFLQNQLSDFPEDEKLRQRRPLLLILYAHYEGFCKFALTLYVNAINREGLPISQVNYALATACLSDLLEAMCDNSSKSDLFRHALPDDVKLHRFARQREFVRSIDTYLSRPARIPVNIVDLESNLKPAVLRKLLYQIGFQHDQFAFIESEIQQLLKARNGIAHGETKDGIDGRTYLRLRQCAFKVMAGVLTQVSQALSEQSYERRTPYLLPASIVQSVLPSAH